MIATFPQTSFLYGESELHAPPQNLQPQLTATSTERKGPPVHPEVLDCPILNSSVTKCFLTYFTESEIAKMRSDLCGVTQY